MLCPNCQKPLDLILSDNQKVLHCPNCGGSFFEENGINRISLETAEKLAADKKTEEISGKEKHCPKDGSFLKPINFQNDGQSPIPPQLTLLRCPQCHGIFAFPDDLVDFKKAQVAKINYFKTWLIPPSSLKTLLVFTFTALIFTGIFANYLFFNKAPVPSSASDVIKKFKLYQFKHYILIFFKTNQEFSSKIIFKDENENKIFEKNISSQPTTTHQITSGDLNLNHNIFYQIVLIDKNGKELKTEWKKLELKP